MRLALAFGIFFLGILLNFGRLTHFGVSVVEMLGLFLMLLGAIQIAFIVGANMFPHTPPALEKLFAEDKKVLWLFAPIAALAGVVVNIVWGLATGRL